jgi:hypothetical protein
MKFNRNSTLGNVAAASIVVGSLAWAPPAFAVQSGRTVAVSVRSLGRTAHTSRARPVVFSIRLEDQLLADLKYLPVVLKPATVPVTPSTTTTTTTTDPTSTSSTTSTTTPSTTTSPSSTTTTTVKSPKAAPNVTTLQSGHFAWRFRGAPAPFMSQWRPGANNVVLQGALMRFQSDHGLPTTGNIDTVTWNAIVQAARTNQVDRANYSYVYVGTTMPEKMKLYINGRVVYTALVNTGISVAPTESGTYPVYLRFTTTTMSGTLPNGQPYHDSGIPWVSYFHGGDALHGFLRSTYGWPQSLGCVEMTFRDANAVWPHTPIGTLVTVQ